MTDTSTILSAEAPAATRSRRGLGRRFFSGKLSLAGTIILVSILFFSFALPFIVQLEPTKVDLASRLQGPSPKHLMGTDAIGRDLLARVAYGGRISLSVGVFGVLLAALIGSAIGLFCGFRGGVPDLIIMRAVDLIMAFPGMLLAIVVTAILGVGLPVLVVAIGLFQVPNFARLVRGLVLSLKEREFVAASHAAGATPSHLLFRQILPNLTGYIVVQVSLNSAWGILSVAALSFLGFGAQPPTPELGAMVNDGRVFLRQAPHLAAFPGLIITMAVLGINFIGDGLRDAFDIRID